MKNKIKKLVNQLLGFRSSPLPVGMTEFNSWAQSIVDTYEMPTQDLTSIRNTLAAAIINLKQTVDSLPKYYFVKLIRAAAAKQVAGDVFYEIQMAKRKAYEEAQKAAQVSPVADVLPINASHAESKEPA